MLLHHQRDSWELQITFPVLPGRAQGGFARPAFAPKLVHLCRQAQGMPPCQPGDLWQIFLGCLASPGKTTELCLAAGSREERDLPLDSSKLILGVKLG